jgi:hypothetical protein
VLPEPLFLAAGLVVLAIGLLSLVRSVRTRRLIGALIALRPQPVDALTPGLRQAKGRIRADRAIPSAFHKRPCVYYAYRVEEPTLGPVPKRLAVGKDWGEASLVDETGDARLHHRPAMIRSPHETITELNGLTEIPAEHAEFFERAGISQKHLGRFKTIRIVEYTLEEGDEVYATGWFDHDDDGKVFYRARRSPLVVSAEPDTRLIPGLKNELLLFSAATALLLVFSLLFLGVAFA